MSSLINDPEGHQPHGPRLGASYLDDLQADLTSPNDFYQPPDPRHLELVETLAARAEATDFNITIDDYQAWCELNWKKPHGTVLSAERLAKKLLEESTELKDSLYVPEDTRQAKVSDELGDVLWCTNALTSDLRVNAKHGLMMLLDKYGHGTRSFGDGSVPPWVRRAQELTFDTNMSAEDIESMINAGYESQVFPVMLVDEPEQATEEEIANAIELIHINSRYLISIAEMNYGEDVYQSGHTLRADVTEYLAARIYLDVAYLAKHAAGSSLSEVIRANILKLSGRVATDTVDKADNPRPS